MLDNKDFKRVLIVLLSFLIAVISGHFKFIIGLVFSILPFIWLIFSDYKNNLNNSKTPNNTLKTIFFSQAIFKLLAIIFCYWFYIELMNETLYIANIFPYLLFACVTLSFILEIVGNKLTKNEGSVQNEQKR